MKAAASVAIVATLLAMSSLALAATPSFCHDIGCPDFTEKNFGNFTLRSYSNLVWISTSIEDATDLDKARTAGFNKLFSYISGNNVPKAKVAMTAPVRTVVAPGQGPFCTTNFTVSFFANTDQPPVPSDSTVSISREGPVTVVVASFGGYDNAQIIQQEITALYTNAMAAGISVSNPNTYAVSGYDSPFRIFDRHNEVWLYVAN
jgi:hypothetical protein